MTSSLNTHVLDKIMPHFFLSFILFNTIISVTFFFFFQINNISYLFRYIFMQWVFFLWWKTILDRQIYFFSGSRILKILILPFKIISHQKKNPLHNFPTYSGFLVSIEIKERKKEKKLYNLKIYGTKTKPLVY